MAKIEWNVGLNGNWASENNWSGGAPNSSTDVTIDAFGTYTVGLASQGVAASLWLDDAGLTFQETAAGSLTITNGFELLAGTAILNASNIIGSGITQDGGLLEIGNDTALGANMYTMSSGELLADRNVTVANEMNLSGAITFAAKHGTTLHENAVAWSYAGAAGSSITFGSTANDGTVLWSSNSFLVTGVGDYTAEVAGGTFKAADSQSSFVFQLSGETLVDANATIDLAGFDGVFSNLQGAGAITSTSGTPQLDILDGGTFSGVLSGPISLKLGSGLLTLTGANTYTGGTTIDSGAVLQLGNGGANGTVKGPITDNGTLIYDHSTAYAPASISGTGGVTYEGGGAVTIDHANSYTGGTLVSGSVITTSKGNAFGSGTLLLKDASLIATTNETLTSSQLVMVGNATIAAAHGKTLAMSSGASAAIGIDTAGTTINIGTATDDGVVVLNVGAISSVGYPARDLIEVHAGILRAGDAYLDFWTRNVGRGVVVDAKATLDMAAFGGTIANLQGTGTVTAQGNANIDLAGGNFAGVISGNASLSIDKGVVLSGNNTFTNGTTIDAGGTLALGRGGASGSVIGDIVDNGTLLYNHNTTFTLTAGIFGTGSVIYDGSGSVTVNRAESYSGGTFVAGGKLSINSASAIGAGPLHLNGGELIATQSMTLSNALSMSGAFTVAAAAGKTLDLASPTGWSLDAAAPGVVTFGDATNTGTVVFETLSPSGISHPGNYAVVVAGVTLQAADSGLGFLFGHDSSTEIAAGAKLDLAGHDNGVFNLSGAGTVTTSTGAANLVVETGDFGGVISGALALDTYGTVILTGKNTLTGGTTVETGSVLQLGNGGASGTVSGAINDKGTVIFDHSGAYTAGQVIGTGGVIYEGGTATVNHANTYSGETMIASGALSIDRATAVSTGGLEIDGELLATKTITLTNTVSLNGTPTIAAATGTTLTLAGTTGWTIIGGTQVTFGATGATGTIVWNAPENFAATTYTIDVHAGMLTAGSDALSGFTHGANSTTIESGATLQLGTFDDTIVDLLGSGTVHGAAGSVLTLYSGNFAGQISGAVALEANGNVTLSGANTFTGGITVEAGGVLTLAHAATQHIAFIDVGTLHFTNASTFTGTVSNFTDGDVFDFDGISAATASRSYNTATGVLTVTDGTHSQHLTLDGSYVLGNFMLTNDSHGGVFVTYADVPHVPLASEYVAGVDFG
jgi:autotransporter-associated beta strand protein